MSSEEYAVDELFSIFGNGRPEVGQAILNVLADHINNARQKHPTFADGPFQALGVMHQEYHEIEFAIEHESVGRSVYEVFYLAAVLIRFANNEHKQQANDEEF